MHGWRTAQDGDRVGADVHLQDLRGASVMRHTFLFEPAVWTATGTFWREDGEPLVASSVTEVAHRPELWLLSGAMKVLGSPPVEFVNAYRIQPAERETGTMRWASEDPTLGKLSGTYTVIGDSILSLYHGGKGGYHGAESLAQIDAGTYRVSGVLLLGERCLSSWQMLLRRTH
jgi:hypothetical protein